MILPPSVDGRRAESFTRALDVYASQYTPELDLSDVQGAGAALLRIFAQIAETVAVRLDRAPQKHFVAFLDALGVVPIPARAARAAVTFKLADGLTSSVSVPANTRVTAAGTDGEIPFETTNDLIAIPGPLTAAFGVDPERDAIFLPPPDFLKQEPRPQRTLKYEVVSFASAKSDKLQLDHVTDLKPGSFLRIDCREKHVVRKVDKGNIVTLERPLAGDTEPGMAVLPILDFQVFNGINVQEHVLYIGHSRVLSVKSEAVVRLTIALQSRSSAPIDMSFQYWTKNDSAVPPEEEHWAPLTVTSDGTAGLTTSGEIVLSKPKDSEIKPRTVDQRESRWIRAVATGPLTTRTATLPEIDSILVGVETPTQGGKPVPIPADQGFYNATPLDVQVDANVGFLPFGSEPRQFDQFYIGSKEAFSKPGAEVKLNVELDLQTLAAPSVVSSSQGLRVYSIGLRRKLYELDVSGPEWRSLGSPSDSPAISYVPVEDSVPAAVATAAGDKLYVFVTTEDSRGAENDPHVWLHSHETSQETGNWTDLGTPAAQVRRSPAALRMPTGFTSFARVFVVTVDGRVYSQGIAGNSALDGGWVDHGAPSNVQLDSPPFVTIAGTDVLVFVTGTSATGESAVHRLTLHGNLTSEWLSLTPTTAFKAASRPFAQTFGAGSDAKVFVLGLTGANATWALLECNTAAPVGSKFDWQSLGWPSVRDNVTNPDPPHPEAHAPCGYLDDSTDTFTKEGKHLFVRDVDNRLYERLDDDSAIAARPWDDRMRPGDPPLRESPAIVVDSTQNPTTIQVFAATSRNSIVRWMFESRHGSPASNFGVELPQSADSTDDAYNQKTLEITGGTGNGDSVTVTAYEGAHRLVRVDPAFGALPDTSTKIEIDGDVIGFAKAGAAKLIALHDAETARSVTLLALRFDHKYRPAGDEYIQRTGLVRLASAAAAAASYRLYLLAAVAGNEFRLADDSALVPELSWEYWNGRGWLSLPVTDTTRDLLTNGIVRFLVPSSIEATEVAGQQNFWVRARLVGGDYGRETFKLEGTEIVSEKQSLRPPKISRLNITYKLPPVPLEACLTFNNLSYLDQTAASQLTGAHFPPFERLLEQSRTLFLGFERPFKTGPVRVLLDAAERNVDPRALPAFRWEFRKDHAWQPLAADDESQALTRQGLLTLSAADELTRETLFGSPLYWIRGSLRTDRENSHLDYPDPLLRGVFPNTVWAGHGETVTDEIVGSSDGEAGQRRPLQHGNVLRELNRNELRSEDIRVRETLSAEEHERIQQVDGADSVVVRDDIGGPWVRWKEVRAFFNAGPNDRVYSVDRAAGILRFGDGVHGTIPPADVDNIRAFRYRTGGGAIGNVGAGEIKTLATAIQGIESVFNPTAAGGGSDTATTDAMLEVGPQQISHRDRAVSPRDFEALALEATRQVARARCLSTTNLVRATNQADPCHPARRHSAVETRGWVSVIIIPKSRDPLPCPSLELRRTVYDYLRARAPSLLVAGDRLVVRPPDYVIVSIRADLFVASLEQAAKVESDADAALKKLLHPLDGGPEGAGWEFGRPIAASDVFAVLERIRDVDHVENLTFHVGTRSFVDGVEIEPNQLLASGSHTLRIRTGEA